jgi:hypothetical protein
VRERERERRLWGGWVRRHGTRPNAHYYIFAFADGKYSDSSIHCVVLSTFHNSLSLPPPFPSYHLFPPPSHLPIFSDLMIGLWIVSSLRLQGGNSLAGPLWIVPNKALSLSPFDNSAGGSASISGTSLYRGPKRGRTVTVGGSRRPRRAKSDCSTTGDRGASLALV